MYLALIAFAGVVAVATRYTASFRAEMREYRSYVCMRRVLEHSQYER